MPITQVDIDQATNVIDELLGNEDEAKSYSENPEGWLTDHGYDGLNPEAVAQCGATYGGGAAVASTGAAASSVGVSGVVAALDPVVYNHYYEIDNSIDNSITNNIVANGNVDVDNTVGDGNVDIEGSVVTGDVQTQTGDGVQVDDSVIDDSNIATGDDNQQAIDQSTNIDDSFNVDEPEPQFVADPGPNGEEAAAPDGAEDAAI